MTTPIIDKSKQWICQTTPSGMKICVNVPTETAQKLVSEELKNGKGGNWNFSLISPNGKAGNQDRPISNDIIVIPPHL